MKKWRDGNMKKRWRAAAILQAEERMHRVRGALGIIALVNNMELIIAEKRNQLDREVS